MCYELKKRYPDCHITGLDKHVKNHLRHLYDSYSPVDISIVPIYFINKEIDCIFHFAAYTSVEEGENDPWKYFSNNVGATLGIIEAAKRYKIKNFIFSSSAAVYGATKSSAFGHLYESQECRPYSVYGKTKHMCEEILSLIKDMNVVRLRYFNACGRNVEAKLYEEHDPETHLIPLLVKNKKATIYGDDWITADGTCVRDYVHVIDICQAHIEAYEDMCIWETGRVNYAANVGSGEGHSVKEVVDKVNKIIHNGEMTIEYKERRNGDVPYLVADTTLIKNFLNFKPKYTLDEIIGSMK